MLELDFETLIKSKNYHDRWYPQSVEQYKHAIHVSGDYNTINLIRSNFAYSMQYIEYLEKQIEELKLPEVMFAMLYKSYIITSMGIIEALFVNLLHSTNNWNRTRWNENDLVISNPKEISGSITKLETHIFVQVEEHDMRMDLDAMLKRVEKKHLLTIDHADFPVLKRLRELRNRVHLHIGVGAYDHDYNIFGFEQIQVTRRILYTVLTCPEICINMDTFQFLKDSFIQHGGVM